MMPPASRGSRGSPPTAPNRIASCFARLARSLGGENVAGDQEVLRAERVFRGENVHLVGGRGAQNGHGLRDHLGADAVASDHGDVKGVTHAGSPVGLSGSSQKSRKLPENTGIRRFRQPTVRPPRSGFVPRSGDVVSLGSAS